ncbi:MAG: protein-L-isoaspartate(D-aspartate) O-methyltransferase [Planctomycetaceae bacterium]|nr:protein-L-isoaspartate(D-aspartate) O-methyltransferase [Planctomycetaceae bacterium]
MSPRPRLLLAIAVLLGALAGGGGGAPALAQRPTRPASFDQARERMVREELMGAGIKNPRVLESARATPRHEFMPASERDKAYYDMALPIGEGQTISPPFVVAYMTEELDPQPGDKVLEIGTGSGYQAAILSPLVKEVYSIEIVEPLGKRAARTLKRLKYENVFTKVGDGFLGWPEHAPFDKIIVTCSPESVPRPLVDQLREGGRLIVPLGERYQQILYLFKKQDGQLVSEALRPTLFVPMTGEAESGRRILPDPLQPGIQNGGFEELAKITDANVLQQEKVAGWHYQRQLELVEAGQGGAVPREGTRFVTFHNNDRGRNSAALQGFAVDGRQIHELDVSAWIRAENIVPGSLSDQTATLAVMFYDERRGSLGEQQLGTWKGSSEWREHSARVRVPPKAREAIVRVGLFGATGRLSVDDVRISAAPAAKPAAQRAGSSR